MKLKFIGTDGSLSLKHGKIYNVNIKTFDKYIIAVIKTGWISNIICPYESMQAFSKNWELK